MQCLILSSKFQPTNDSELWSDVVKRKQKTRPTVVGTKGINEKNNVKLKGVTKVVSLHITDLHLIQRLKNLNSTLNLTFQYYRVRY
ncbi:hypothetical protein C0J52_23797 [Blattella germanica]|nr:hypothetical protein C0J52_23797 [Blattella germanica]